MPGWGTSFSIWLPAASLLLQVDPNLDQAKAADLSGERKMPAGMEEDG